jgi:hypothetical protein
MDCLALIPSLKPAGASGSGGADSANELWVDLLVGEAYRCAPAAALASRQDPACGRACALQRCTAAAELRSRAAPRRVSVARVPVAGFPGPAERLCSATLQAGHYSLAASPCGRFVAAGGDRGLLYIFAYLRGRPAGTAGGGGMEQPEPPPAAAPSDVEPEAELVSLAVFAFPVSPAREASRALVWGAHGDVAAAPCCA